MSKHSHISAIFDNAFQSRAGSPDVYMSMVRTLIVNVRTLIVNARRFIANNLNMRTFIVNVRTFIVLGYFVLATLSLVRLLVKASLVKLARYRIGREPVVQKLDSGIHRVMIQLPRNGIKSNDTSDIELARDIKSDLKMRNLNLSLFDY